MTDAGAAFYAKVEVKARLSADAFGFVLRAVVDGVGLGLLPLFLCPSEISSGPLVRVLPKYSMQGTALNVLYPSARYLPRRVAALRDFLVAELGKRKR